MKHRKLRYWWYNPYKLLAGFILPFFVFICLYPFDNAVDKGIYAGRYYIDFLTFLLGLLFLTLLGLTSFLTVKSKRINFELRKRSSRIKIKSSYLDLLFILTLLGYIVWFYWVLLNPQILINVLLGEGAYSIRNTYDTIPGLTTLAQLGVLYVCIYYYEYRKGNEYNIRYKIYFATIICFTLIRTILWSERLALLEIAVPIALIFLSTYRPPKKIIRKIIHLLPYIGILAVLVLFGVFEFFRSWQTYKDVYNSYWSFILDRLSLYYFTAVNNVAGILNETNWPSYSFDSFLNWIYEFPVIGSFIEELRPAESYGNWKFFLTLHLDPEFNNPSGILVVFTNSGILGGIVFAILAGFFSGITYLQFLYGKGIGKYLFPIFFIYLLDMIRIPYITSTRTFPIILFAFIGYYLFSQNENHKRILFLKSGQ